METVFKIKLEPIVINDIQEVIEFYNKKQIGLGKRFHQTIKLALETLAVNPFYQIRYDNVRCYFTKPFPYLIHYIVDVEHKTIHVLAILHTSRKSKLT
jgi:plasmid stabilization system protein ParE